MTTTATAGGAAAATMTTPQTKDEKVENIYDSTFYAVCHKFCNLMKCKALNS